MALPETVIEWACRRAWEFLERYPRTMGYFAEEMSPTQQEEYKEILRNQKLSNSVVFLNPVGGTPMLPITVISPQNDVEDVQFVGDEADDYIPPEELPFPPVAPDDYRDGEAYYGILSGLTTKPQFIPRGGDASSDVTRHHDKVELHRGIQRYWGDEQREKVGFTQKVFNALKAYIGARAVIDRVTVSISVKAINGEQANTFARILRSVLRQWSEWFHVNGIQNPIFSMGPLYVDADLQPAAGGSGASARDITMSFQYEDRFYEVLPVLAKFMVEVDMVTPTGDEDGGTDLTRVATIEAGESVLKVPDLPDEDE